MHRSIGWCGPSNNCCLSDGDGEKLWAYTSAGAALGEISFTMAALDKQKARTVLQQLWTRSVEISDSKAGRITAIYVVAREIGAPKGVKPIETLRRSGVVERTASQVY
jgi:hypothetical protein